jgi:hypothetical protein
MGSKILACPFRTETRIDTRKIRERDEIFMLSPLRLPTNIGNRLLTFDYPKIK